MPSRPLNLFPNHITTLAFRAASPVASSERLAGGNTIAVKKEQMKPRNQKPSPPDCGRRM
jgi:hypothetical protein